MFVFVIFQINVSNFYKSKKRYPVEIHPANDNNNTDVESYSRGLNDAGTEPYEFSDGDMGAISNDEDVPQVASTFTASLTTSRNVGTGDSCTVASTSSMVPPSTLHSRHGYALRHRNHGYLQSSEGMMG